MQNRSNQQGQVRQRVAQFAARCRPLQRRYALIQRKAKTEFPPRPTQSHITVQQVSFSEATAYASCLASRQYRLPLSARPHCPSVDESLLLALSIASRSLMGGPALLPGAVPPPKHRRLLPWTQAALPVPKPARALPRRRGQDPFADIVAGVQDLIQNIGKGAYLVLSSIICNLACATDASRHLAPSGPKFDLVLSSGFLAFAAHSGFLKAVEEVRATVRQSLTPTG